MKIVSAIWTSSTFTLAKTRLLILASIAACGSASVNAVAPPSPDFASSDFTSMIFLLRLGSLDAIRVLGGQGVKLLTEVAVEFSGDVRATLGPVPGQLVTHSIHLAGDG